MAKKTVAKKAAAKKAVAKGITPPPTLEEIRKFFNQVQEKLYNLEVDLRTVKKDVDCFVQHPGPPTPTKPPKQ